MYVYTDAASDVIARSKEEKSLAEAQAIKPAITAVIVNAPAGIVLKGEQSAAEPFYHRHSSGDGSQLSHYIGVAALKPLKVARAAEITARSTELLAAGFLSATVSKRFAMDLAAMQRYLVLWQTRNEATATYPVILITWDGEGKQSLNSAAAVNILYTEANLAVRAVLEGESALLEQIIEATSVAEINAVIDDR